ncbi:EAL domain-containing protein [Bradyrhizobium sp.]|uniref:bifunctional diguanylate cyclase/phosphodiesterase n=1 Tax=Bradyrhizobium sp. TaxID=376 RepID=UPI0025C26FAB|nr:EAL domain-containing protein [Bradyrhizobium sp.]
MLRGPVTWLVLCGAVLSAAILVGTVVMIDQFRERALANGQRELENTVLLLTRHFDQQFEDSDTIARNIIAQMGIPHVTSPDEFRQRLSTFEAHEALKSKVSVLSYIGDVNFFDINGRLINSSGSWPLPEIDISDRAYFSTLRSGPPYQSVLAESVRSYFTGNWTTVVAHRLSGPDGSFLGAMGRRIDPANFEKFFASLSLGKGAAISMFHRDGTLIARHPHVAAMIGQKLFNAPLVESVQTHGGVRSMKVRSPVDGKERIGTAAALRDYPITIVVTTTLANVLADWRDQTHAMIAGACLLMLAIGATLLLIIRQIGRQNRESQQRLESQKQQLDTALNNMTQGLVLYDGSKRLVLCNQRFMNMFGLSPDMVKPGTSSLDIMKHRHATGSFDGDPVKFHDEIQLRVAKGEVTTSIVNSRDGRTFQIVNQPLPQGGWVATMEDVTERQRLEQERDRNYAFLSQILDHIPSQITVKDARDRRYLLANRVAEEQFGMPREQIVGKTAPDLFPPHSVEIINADDEKTLQSGSLFKDEHLWDSQALGKRYITSTRIGIRDNGGDVRYIVNVVNDVTEHRRAHERIAHLAHYDPLTDLPNRVLFREQMQRELQKVSRGDQFALLYIDVDEFKGINDSLGHHVGDELLKAVAGRIRGCIRESDMIARLGGDEFAVIQTSVKGVNDVLDVVTRIHEALRQPFQCLGHHLSSDASIGIALAPQDGTDIDQLIKNADLAMYGAKADGRRTYRFFEPEMDASAKARLALEQDLRHALTNGGFEIHYQPLVDLRNDQVTGCEALVRWRHPERGMISPAAFIPVAEDTGLIVELGEWVLRTACAEAANWPEHVRLAVNVSPVQLREPTLALRIASALAASGLPANRLEIEITEAVLIGDDATALAILHELKSIGVRIALDDFGTGYSSLSYLKRFPFDKIKIDRCFVTDIAEADGSSVIVQAVVNIAASCNMTTVAEGVETPQQKELLRALGCNQMQGFLFSGARPSAEVRKLLVPSSSDDVAAVA